MLWIHHLHCVKRKLTSIKPYSHIVVRRAVLRSEALTLCATRAALAHPERWQMKAMGMRYFCCTRACMYKIE